MIMNNKLNTMKPKMTGVSMIEVLVTLVILSIGLLGMAGLQLSSIRGTNSSNYRTQASLLANDIIERMRANPGGVNGNQFLALDSADLGDCTALPSPYCGEYYSGAAVAAETCTTTEMATYDFDVWFCGIASPTGRQGGVQNALPQATATITCTDTDPLAGADVDPCTNGSPHVITIGWSELNPDQSTGATANVAQTISITMQP
jgi:type IV pilus assembly protein PilV